MKLSKRKDLTGFYFVFLVGLFIFSTQTTHALILTEAYKSAIENSYILKGKRYSTEAYERKSKVVLSKMLPQVHLKSVSKYIKDLNEETTINTYYGDVNLEVDESEYSFSTYISLQYDLLKFGANWLDYENAKLDYAIAEIDQDFATQKLKESVLTAYIKALKAKSEISTSANVSGYRKQIYVISSKLHEAGKIDRLELLDTALAFANEEKHLMELREKLTIALKSLSMHTHIKLTPDTPLELAPPEDEITTTSAALFPEIKKLRKEITKKQNEYKKLNRERLPSISLVANYSLYNTDEHSYKRAYKYAKAESSSVSVVVSMPLFEGFRKTYQQQSIRNEISAMKYELKQIIYENETQIDSLKNQLKSGMSKAEQSEEINSVSDNKSLISTELKNNYSLSSIDHLNNLIANEQTKLSQKIIQIDNMYLSEQIKIFNMDKSYEY